MLFYDLLNNTKGPVDFQSTVKVPPPVTIAPPVAMPPAPVTMAPPVELLTQPEYMSFLVDDYSIPAQPVAVQPEEGIMTVDTNNTLTPEEAAALTSFTGGSNSYANIGTYANQDPPVDQTANPTPTSTPTGSNQTSERNPNNEGNPPDSFTDPFGSTVNIEDYQNAYPDLDTSSAAAAYTVSPESLGSGTVGMSDPNTPNGETLTNGPVGNPYLVATEYELMGLQPDRTGQNPFARPGPNTVSMPANETIYNPKDDLSQQYFAPQDAKYAEGGEVKDPDYFTKTADENYDIKDYLLDTIPKGISKYLLLNPYEGLDRQVGEELAGYVDTRMENYRARELQERLDRLYEGMTPEEIEAYNLAFIKNVGSSAP